MATVCANINISFYYFYYFIIIITNINMQILILLIIWSFFRLDILMYIKRTVHSVHILVIPLGIAFHCFEKGNICFTRNSFFQQGLRLAAALEYQQSYSVTKMR